MVVRVTLLLCFLYSSVSYLFFTLFYYCNNKQQAQLQQSFGVLVNAPGGPTQKFDAAKALRTEADGLEMFISPKSQLDDVEKRILGKQYPKKSKKAGPGDYIFAGTGGAKNRNKGKRK